MDEYVTKEQVIDYYRPYGQTDEPIPFETLVSDLRDMKTADVSPVRHGRWIGCNGEIVDWDENNPGCPRHSCFCSICKSWLTASDEFPVIAYFCPNCGAKMDLE